MKANDVFAILKSRISKANDYSVLSNKPSINGVEISGDMTLENIGIHEITGTEMKEIIAETEK